MPPRVLVVGGGLAGVSAALALADGGHDVELLEARPRLGGAACSFRRGALTVDNGQHVFLRCCTEYLAFLRRLGATGHVTLQPRLSVPVLRPGGPAGRLWRDPLPAPLHLARALGGYVHLPFRQRLGVVRTALAMYRLDPADPVLDRRTLGDWLAARGQSRAAVEALWDLIGRATLNATASDASLALAAMVFRTGLLTRAGAADLGYPRVPLGDLHDTLAERALRDASARVRRRSRVIGVAAHEDGVRAWLAGGVTVSADAVILAVPHDAAARLLPEDAWPGLPRFGGLATSPIVNVHVRYDRQVTDLPFAAGVGSPVQWVFDRTTASGQRAGQYLAVTLSAATETIGWPVAEFRRCFPAALADLFPAARRAEVLDLFVTKERSATFLPAPGTAALRPGPCTANPRVFLAGAWTATGWPATMEGAVRSGRAAADAVRARHG